MAKDAEIPAQVQRHLAAIAADMDDLPEERAMELLVEAWLAKRALYEEQTLAVGMKPVQRIDADDGRGVLLLTWSGSLIALGPATDDGRSLHYVRIGPRSDGPESVSDPQVLVDGAIERDKPIRFASGPISRSSEVLEIAVFDVDTTPADQHERLRQAMIFLSNGFVHAQRSLTLEEAPEQFTMRSIVRFVADQNGATQTLTRSIIDDFLHTISAGVLLGRRVPLGRIGRIALAPRAAQKARMGRNPATGEEMLLPAKAATAVPRMSFSAPFKERAAQVPLERIESTVGEEDDQDGA